MSAQNGIPVNRIPLDSGGRWQIEWWAWLTQLIGLTTPVQNYTVAGLPSSAGAGQVAFATNGRKPGQGAGSGTGMLVFYDGTAWISVSSGTTIAA
jgi:hypothetical protein